MVKTKKICLTKGKKQTNFCQCIKGPCNQGDTSADLITRQETFFDNMFDPFTKEYRKFNRHICKTRNPNNPWSGLGLGSGLDNLSGTLGCCTTNFDSRTRSVGQKGANPNSGIAGGFCNTVCYQVSKGCIDNGNNNVPNNFEREAENFDNLFNFNNINNSQSPIVCTANIPILPYASQGSGALNAINQPVCQEGANNNAENLFDIQTDRFDNTFLGGFNACKRCRDNRCITSN